MRLLYLDDSGSVADTNQKHIVLGGVCVSENGVRWLSNKLDELAQCIEPSDPNSIEFHAAEIYAGRDAPWNRYSKNDRIEIIRNVLHTLDDAYESTITFAIAIQKFPSIRFDPMLTAYEAISQAFNNHLEYDNDPPDRGLIILDNTSYETGMQKLAVEIRKTGNRIGLQNRSIIEIPLFVDSKASRIIQLADHIAYAVFRRYEASDISYYNIIENRFLFKDGKIRTLIHRNNSANCTCPACITRKR